MIESWWEAHQLEFWLSLIGFAAIGIWWLIDRYNNRNRP